MPALPTRIQIAKVAGLIPIWLPRKLLSAGRPDGITPVAILNLGRSCTSRPTRLTIDVTFTRSHHQIWPFDPHFETPKTGPVLQWRSVTKAVLAMQISKDVPNRHEQICARGPVEDRTTAGRGNFCEEPAPRIRRGGQLATGTIRRLRRLESSRTESRTQEVLLISIFYFFKRSSIAPPSFFIGMSLATIFPSRSIR